MQYDGGTSGGTIGNCAHLTGTGSTTTVGGFTFPNVTGADLQACDTGTISPAACTLGTVGCDSKDSDVTTYVQAEWEDDPTLDTNTAAALLYNNYTTVHASTSGLLEVGIPGTAGYSMLFTTVLDLQTYPLANGFPGPLTSDLINPISTSSGEFGGEVVALHLNIDFSDAGLTLGIAGARFGNLTLCGFSTLTALNGLTVRQYEGIVDTLLGGGSSGFSIADLDPLAEDLNLAFFGGTATASAQDHLFQDACP